MQHYPTRPPPSLHLSRLSHTCTRSTDTYLAIRRPTIMVGTFPTQPVRVVWRGKSGKRGGVVEEIRDEEAICPYSTSPGEESNQKSHLASSHGCMMDPWNSR